MTVSRPVYPWDVNTPIDQNGNLASQEMIEWLNSLVVALGGEGQNIAEEAKTDVETVAVVAKDLGDQQVVLDAAVVTAQDAAAAAKAAADAAQADANAVEAQATAIDGNLTALTTRIDNYAGSGPIP